MFCRAMAAGVQPREASRVLISTMISLRRQGHAVHAVSEADLEELFLARAESRFAPEAWRRLIIAVVAGSSPARAIREVVGEVPSEEEIETAVEYALGAGPKIEDPAALRRNRMGIAMTNLRGRVAGARVMAELGRALGEVRA